MTKSVCVQLPKAPDIRSLTTSNTDKNTGSFAARTTQGISSQAFTLSGSKGGHGNVRIVNRAMDVVPEESGQALRFNYWNIIILAKNKVKKMVGRGCFGKVFRAVQVPWKFTIGVKGGKKMSRFYMVKDNDNILYSFFKSNERKYLKEVGEFCYSPWYRRNRLVMHDKGANLKMLFDLDKIERDSSPPTRQDMPGHLKRSITRQSLEYLQKIHDKGILHSDIKPENITINSRGEVSLIDYGAAVKRNGKGQFKASILTPLYAAPERLDWGIATEKLDIWSLGITLAEMELGHVPIVVKERRERLSPSEQLVLKLRPELKDLFVEFEFDSSAYDMLINQIKQKPGISEDCRNVLLACLEVDPDKRPSARELLTYPYLRQQKLDEMGHMELHIAHQNAFKALVEAEKAIEKKGKRSSDAEMKKLSTDLAQCQQRVQKIQGMIRKENG